MIALKELRETNSGLRIIDKSSLLKAGNDQEKMLKENDELISIFMQSVKTARKNLEN
jgi:four helix bundle protein